MVAKTLSGMCWKRRGAEEEGEEARNSREEVAGFGWLRQRLERQNRCGDSFGRQGVLQNTSPQKRRRRVSSTPELEMMVEGSDLTLRRIHRRGECVSALYYAMIPTSDRIVFTCF